MGRAMQERGGIRRNSPIYGSAAETNIRLRRRGVLGAVCPVRRCARAAEAWTPARGGFSLIEIVVGLVLMGSVLVGSLLALSRHRRQMALAEDRVVAVMAADELLQQLTSQRDGIPLAGRGVIAGRPGWIWETRVVGLARPLDVPVRVVRLSIVSTDGISTRNLVSVEVVKAAPEGVGDADESGVAR